MSEQVAATESLKSPMAAVKGPERRQMRRAGISLQIRVRTADFNDGNFDEIRSTQNASRKAIYFFTSLDRYYRGMRVRVTSPYDPNAISANFEQIGEVVRVHRRENDYGVAIAILAGAQSTPGQSPRVAAGAHAPVSTIAASAIAPSERRCAERSPFISPVELVEMRTGSRVQARTSDLSPQGCYVDTLNPFPVGTAVRVLINRSGITLDVLANVSSRHAGSGMGLVFSEITKTQQTILESWLSDVGLPRTVYENPFPAPIELSHMSLLNKDCAVRLVQMLQRKGLLSQTEAGDILGEYVYPIEI